MRRVVLGLDQGATTGWGIAGEGLGRVVRHGVARTVPERLAVVRLALEFAGGDPRYLFAMFEQHDHMPLDRLTNHDRHTMRRAGNRQAAPERSTKSVMGQGANKGRWQEQLGLIGMPSTHELEVRPATWRSAIHGVIKGDEETIKGAALRWACSHFGQPFGFIKDHNEAEGICLAAFGALHGLARYDADKQAARVDARVKRELAKQVDLFGGSK